MKRVLITGGSGFVGANLVRRLLRDGHETHLILRPTHHPWRLEQIASDFRRHEVDLQDHAAVESVLNKVRPDWVIHLAAYGAYPAQIGIQQMLATNLLGTVALLDACVNVGVEAFISTGSSSEYGYKDHPPSEDEVLEPNSHYAITKASATHYCQFVARRSDVNAVTLRLYSIYGPYEEPTRLIPTLLMHGLRGTLPPLVSPRTARDYVYVDDAVDAIAQVAGTQSISRGAIYNVCSGVQSTLADVVTLGRSILRVTAEPKWSTMGQRTWDTDRWAGSPARIEREIGWRSQTSLESGLKSTIAWFEQHPEWRRLYADRIFV